jgi:hypothetical protein
MHILFEAIRANSKRGQLITYESGLHASHGASTLSGGTNTKLSHSLKAAFISCQQQLPDHSYKDAFQNY